MRPVSGDSHTIPCAGYQPTLPPEEAGALLTSIRLIKLEYSSRKPRGLSLLARARYAAAGESNNRFIFGARSLLLAIMLTAARTKEADQRTSNRSSTCRRHVLQAKQMDSRSMEDRVRDVEHAVAEGSYSPAATASAGPLKVQFRSEATPQ
jgi:hypothetical protein